MQDIMQTYVDTMHANIQKLNDAMAIMSNAATNAVSEFVAAAELASIVVHKEMGERVTLFHSGPLPVSLQIGVAAVAGALTDGIGSPEGIYSIGNQVESAGAEERRPA